MTIIIKKPKGTYSRDITYTEGQKVSVSKFQCICTVSNANINIANSAMYRVVQKNGTPVLILR